MAELEKSIQEILDACPSEMSPPQLAAIIANIINVYNFAHLWPIVSAQTSTLLYNHETIEDAVSDAEEFLKRIARNTLH